MRNKLREQKAWNSLDHLVSSCEQCRRDRDAERLRCLEVDHQLELSRLLDGEIAGLGAFEDLADIHAHLAIPIREAGCVTYQAASSWVLAPSVDRGHCVAGGQDHDLVA